MLILVSGALGVIFRLVVMISCHTLKEEVADSTSSVLENVNNMTE